MVDVRNVRENLLKHGWFAAPVEKCDIFSASELPSTQKKSVVKLDNEVIGNCIEKQPLGKIKEPKDVIEKLLYMLVPGKERLKEGKSRGSVNMIKMQEMLLNLGWYKKMDARTTSVDIDSHKPASDDKMTKLDKWFTDFEDRKNQTNHITAAEISTATQSEVEKILDLLSTKRVSVQARESQGTMDKQRIRENLLMRGWYVVSSYTQLSKPTTNTAEHDKPRSADFKSKERSKDSKIDKQAVAQGKDILNRIRKKKRQYVKHEEKSLKKTKPVINNLLQQGWSVTNHSRYQITMVKIPEAQNKPKTTSLHKATCENASEMNGNKVDAPVLSGVSHQKKTLLRRFVRRSRKMIGRYFTCGKKED